MRLSLLALAAAAHGALVCRNAYLWPFSASSAFNAPIGAGAIFEPAGIFAPRPLAEACALRAGPSARLRRACDGWNSSWTRATCLAEPCCYDDTIPGVPWCHAPAGGPPASFHNDADFIVAARVGDALVPWRDQNDWSPGNHCISTGPVAAHVPLPHDFVTPDCGGGNNALALLLPDNRTLLQMQPAFRAAPGGDLLAAYHRGCPVDFPWAVDVRADAPWGAHGGSGLSAIGGTLRLGELLPGALPIAHALKLELWAHAYYFYDWASGDYSSCFTWPAVGCDSYYKSTSGDGYNGTHPLVHPGALLAVPPAAAPAVAAGLRTEPARRILQALVDYGGYIVDDTGSQQGGGALCMERGVTAELRAAYNISVAIEEPLTPGQGGELYADLVAIFRALAVVANNSPNSVGGGGTPRRPPPPPFC